LKAVVVSRHGGPEVLDQAELPMPEPAAGQVRVRIHAIGVNRRDAFIRAGIYKRDLPLVPGIEAAGVLDAIGPGVTGWAIGDRVVYYVPERLGAYAEYQAVPAERVVKLPAALSFNDAAAIFDHGLTAHYLSTSTFPLRKGHRVLIQAAAGGVGILLTQLAKRFGATVYGTVSTAEKAELIRKAGADEAILYRDTDFVEAVRRLTGGRGVDVVYDSVGKDTFDKSLNCLRPRGMLVLFGQASGAVPPFDPQILNAKGCLYLTRPRLDVYIESREELVERAGDVLGWIASGKLKLRQEHTYSLAEAAQAHNDLNGRKTTGKVVLVP
jgi:NADPH2:quinone reductase